MRRRTFLGNKYTIAGGNVTASESVACDICLYEKGTDSLVIIPQNVFDVKIYPLDSYTPVGVVVVPGTHNVYGDSSCGVMSLKEMNHSTPDNGGTSYQKIYWGHYGTDISTLTNYDQVCRVGSYGTVNQTVQGVTDTAYLPSDNFTTLQNPYDTDTYFNNNSLSYIPSPYNDDDTRNPAYYQTASPSSTANALSDFDGVGNTEILCSLATAQTDWKTASTITDKYTSGYSPAACCCWRYHTEGTKQGDWYLPACGEVGYIMPKFKKIQQAIETLTSAYGSTVGVQLYDETNCHYWTSSENGSYYARRLVTGNGQVSNSNRNYSYYARAFLRVGV